MKENRMLASVKVPEGKVLGGLYALFAILGVVLFLMLGSEIGEILLSYLIGVLPANWVQGILYTVDPLFLSLIIFIVPSILLCLWVAYGERRSVAGLGFFKEGAWLELGKGLFIGFLLISAVVGLQVLTASITFREIDFSVNSLISLVFIFPFWLIQSGTEELLTRGWLFPVVSRNSNLWVGTAVSSLLFAVLHLGNPSVSWISLLNIALFGLLACLYVLKTDNIWGISAIHAAWNYFQGSFYGLNVSGLSTAYATMRFENGEVPDLMSGGDFGPEASLFSSLVMGVYILYLAWDLYQKKQSQA